MSVIKPIREIRKSTTLYKFKGLLWQPLRVIMYGTTGRTKDDIHSIPFCPKCKAELTQRSDTDFHCDLCEQYYKVEPNIDHVRQLAYKAYHAKLKEGFTVVTLDLPPGIIKSEDESEDFWIEARIGQKDGKLMAVIYFGDKKRGRDGKKDYSQVFLDFDDEQMRFDKANKNPLEIIAKLKAEFLSSIHTSEKKTK